MEKRKAIRLDKYLADIGAGTRSEVKKMLKKGVVSVNGVTEKSADRKIFTDTDCVCVSKKQVCYRQYEYLMFYKPAGCVSATKDRYDKTVLDYISRETCPMKDKLFPVGRLDKDTEGLLILTNDGELSHQLLSPSKHVKKTYYACLRDEIKDEDVECFLKGVDIGEEKRTLPASLEPLEDKRHVLVRITEGKFHQVKRMFHVCGNEVLYLKRLAMGKLVLDEALKPGQYRSLSEEELALLKDSENNQDKWRKQMLKGKKAVIFDLDGTLIDSMGVWCKVDEEYLAMYNQEVPDDLHKAIEGMSFAEGAKYFIERFGIPKSSEEIQKEWNDMAFHIYINDVCMKPGAGKFVKKLKEKGYKLAIATSNSTHLVQAVLNKYEILQCFDAIVTSDDVPEGKPKPDIYLEASRRIEVEPEQCFVFEDIVMGILAGKNAGMTTCAVRDSFSEYQWEEKKKIADYYIEDYEEVDF